MSRVGTVCLTLTLAVIAGCDAPAPITAPAPGVGPAALTTASVVVVLNTNDAGPGSLRQALADAVGDETIQFDPAIAGQTITLATGPLEVTQPLIIEGPAAGITIDANRTSQVMRTNANGVVLRNLTITGGKTTVQGGGIENLGTLTIDHSTITGNEASGSTGFFASNGGGVFNVGSAVLGVINSTISGNSAEGSGGGIYGDGTMTLINSTVAYNDALIAGGATANFGAQLLLHNSLIANNSSGSGLNPNCLASPGIIVYDGTNLSNDASCGIDPAMLLGDPILGPLASNGGPTRTHALLIGSAAVDAATSCTVTTDQRYVARPQLAGGACDIGAYEFTEYLTAALAIDASVTVNPSTGTAVVSGTVSCDRQSPADLEITLVQKQKVGRVSATIQATDLTSVDCIGKKYWSVALAPASGGFQTGAATASVKTSQLDKWYAPTTTASTVKLYWGRK